MQNWNTIATEETIAKTIGALKKNGINAIVVDTGAEAKEKALSLLPNGAEVFTLTSETTREIGLMDAIDTSGKYRSVRTMLMSMDRQKDGLAMQKLGTAPEYAVASVNAVTEEGHIFIASNTGSQLPADSYGAAHVIWVVGAQKIVKDDETARKRIDEYVLPKESTRIRTAYNLPDTYESFVSKLLIINREIVKDRITLIFIKEPLGF